MSEEPYSFASVKGAPGGPLVFAFHGTGGDENQLVPLATGLVPSATVVSPRGDVSEFGALRFFRRTGEGVYDMADLARRTEAMGRFVAAHAGRGAARPVIGIGYSNGANIAWSLLLKEPAALAGAVLLRAMLPFDPRPLPSLNRLPVLLIAGRYDELIPVAHAGLLADLLREAGAEIDYKVLEAGHRLTQDDLQLATQWLARRR